MLRRLLRRHRVALALLLAACLPVALGTALSTVPEAPPRMLEQVVEGEVWDPEDLLPWPHRFVMPGSPAGIPLQTVLIFGATLLGAALLTTVVLWVLRWRGMSPDAPLNPIVGGILALVALGVTVAVATPPDVITTILAMVMGSVFYLGQAAAWWLLFSRLSRP